MSGRECVANLMWSGRLSVCSAASFDPGPKHTMTQYSYIHHIIAIYQDWLVGSNFQPQSIPQ